MTTPHTTPELPFLLFEHEDGRYAVNPNTTGDPKWHRLGPVELPAAPQEGVSDAILKNAKAAIRHWNEFGPEFQFAICMDHLQSAIEAAPQPPASALPLAVGVETAPVTLPQRLDELIAQHGTLRAAARVIDIDAGYLSRLHSGEKVKPGKDFLRRMGLRSVTIYERTK